MNNANVYYRYHNPFKPGNYITIAYANRIADFHPYFFGEVLYRGITQIIEELNISYSIEDAVSGRSLWVFNGHDEDFKVAWEFEGRKPFDLRIGYYVNNEQVDHTQALYDYKTYEEALDFIKAYIENIITNGVPQEPEVEYDEDAVAQLKLMHSVMQSMNNEDAYYSWILTGVPDGATKEDYIDIASNPEEFDDCLELFDSLFTEYASDGLFRPSSDEIAFAKRVCERLGLPSIEIYN